jgi:uncharacterized protein (DUF427 family)
MPRAIWKGQILAESDKVEVVEGNLYFPPDALKTEFLRDSKTTTVCPWKGTANYYDVVVDGEVNKDAAWVYRETKRAAANITLHVAFWRGVEVEQ